MVGALGLPVRPLPEYPLGIEFLKGKKGAVPAVVGVPDQGGSPWVGSKLAHWAFLSKGGGLLTS